ncbi:hypothetical protein LAZ67_7002744 [Cordylochernes scorpioides]|uniref:Reverse transcriptase RNase H-like domain-containing protein n=1 Tax=Cordylochernes scorpioides TaxID=51811 RepID=A0ABY6KND6_9ARAC|nr:hypothetical protein LAZ67_7002744 [Cordylochernes scorpioides]
MPRRSRPLIGRNTAASRRYRNAIAIETPLQSETRRALRRLRYSEARVAAAKSMQVPVQRIQLWTHKPFSGLQYNTHIDYTADSSVDIGQMSRVCQFCSALRFRDEPFGLCCKQGESISEYLGEFKHLAIYCNFVDMLGTMMRDRFVAGIKSEILQKKLLQEDDDVTLDKVFAVAISFELAEINTRELQDKLVAKISPMELDEKYRMLFKKCKSLLMDYGLGVILSHRNDRKEDCPIAFASRTLTEAEKRYSQLEKEALSITYGDEKSRQYLLGRKFVLVTVNRPLIHIFSPQKPIPYVQHPELKDGIDSNIKELTRECRVCQESASMPPATISEWTWPEKPWHRLHLDLAGGTANEEKFKIKILEFNTKMRNPREVFHEAVRRQEQFTTGCEVYFRNYATGPKREEEVPEVTSGNKEETAFVHVPSCTPIPGPVAVHVPSCTPKPEAAAVQVPVRSPRPQRARKPLDRLEIWASCGQLGKGSGLVVKLVFCLILTPTMGLWLAHGHAGVWLGTGGVKSSTIDVAPSMTGKTNGFVALLRKKQSEISDGSNIPHTHCIIHQEVLCTKVIKMENVLTPIKKFINFIRSRGLNQRQFSLFLTELESEYSGLSYYIEVRWLSCSKVLKQFWDLKEEICQFLITKNQDITLFSDQVWLQYFSFMVDITKHLSDLNLKLQGKDQIITNMCDQVSAFKCELVLWEKQLKNEDLMHFPTCNMYKSSLGETASYQKYAEKILSLRNEFETRFSDFKSLEGKFTLFSSIFSINIESVPNHMQMEVIDIQCDSDLKAKFIEVGVSEFYKYLPARFENTRKLAYEIMSMFGSIYRCKQLFSLMKGNKSPIRSRIIVHLGRGSGCVMGFPHWDSKRQRQV